MQALMGKYQTLQNKVKEQNQNAKNLQEAERKRLKKQKGGKMNQDAQPVTVVYNDKHDEPQVVGKKSAKSIHDKLSKGEDIMNRASEHMNRPTNIPNTESSGKFEEKKKVSDKKKHSLAETLSNSTSLVQKAENRIEDTMPKTNSIDKKITNE